MILATFGAEMPSSPLSSAMVRLVPSPRAGELEQAAQAVFLLGAELHLHHPQLEPRGVGHHGLVPGRVEHHLHVGFLHPRHAISFCCTSGSGSRPCRSRAR